MQNLALQNAAKPFGLSKMSTKQPCRMLDGECSHYIQIAISSKTDIAIHMNREPVIYDELIQSPKKVKIIKELFTIFRVISCLYIAFYALFFV